MSEAVRRVIYGVLGCLTVVLAATAGYVLSGHTFINSLYMVVITVFGIGYREIIPIQSPALQLFTIGVIVAGTTVAVYTVSATVQLMTQGEIERMVGARRRMREIQALKGHTIVCGYGRMGQILARDLAAKGRTFVVIEQNDQNLSIAESRGYLLIKGDATSEEILNQAGIDKASNIACVLPNDADNVFVSLSARNLNREIMIVARGEVPTTDGKLRQAGADHVILPPAIGGSRMAEIILGTYQKADAGTPEADALERDLETLGLVLCEFEVEGESVIAGQDIHALKVPSPPRHIVVGVRDRTGKRTLNPEASHTLNPGDTLLVVCPQRDREAVLRALQGTAAEG